ncbi:hypothetical protein BH10PSE15_BH10PSE15_02670 [soil metagenome]
MRSIWNMTSGWPFGRTAISIPRCCIPSSRASYRRLARDYAIHRAAIDAVVRQATDYQTTREDHAAVMLRRVVQPTFAISEATAILAQGGDAIVPCLDRTDELGRIANAVEQFRRATAARTRLDAEAAEQRLVSDGLASVFRTMAGGDLIV